MSLSSQFRRVANVRFYDVKDGPDQPGIPGRGWILNQDVKGVYCKNGDLKDIYIDSHRHGLTSKPAYEKKIGLRFSVSGTMT